MRVRSVDWWEKNALEWHRMWTEVVKDRDSALAHVDELVAERDDLRRQLEAAKAQIASWSDQGPYSQLQEKLGEAERRAARLRKALEDVQQYAVIRMGCSGYTTDEILGAVLRQVDPVLADDVKPVPDQRPTERCHTCGGSDHDEELAEVKARLIHDSEQWANAEADLAQNHQLREACKLAQQAIASHKDWCGFNKDAPGDGVWYRAWYALRDVLADDVEPVPDQRPTERCHTCGGFDHDAEECPKEEGNMNDIKLCLVWRDNEPVIKMRCPSCAQFADIDGDQYYGRVSLDCSNCEYHETHDLRGIPIVTPDPRADTPVSEPAT